MRRITFPKIEYPSWGAIEAALRAPTFLFNGARKIATNVQWSPDTLPWIDGATMRYLDYARPDTKLKALQRMYFSETECERIKALLLKRKGQAFTAVAFSTIAGAKDSRSMGHCINSIALSITPKKCEATIFYRSTELIKKFCADLAFFPWVFEQLGVEPSRVTFSFANCFVSGVFFPTLLAFVDPIEFLEFLRNHDPELFVVATRFLRRAVQTEHQAFPFSPERMQHAYMWREYPVRIPSIKKYLAQHLKGPIHVNRTGEDE
jgi:hypothetical protein